MSENLPPLPSDDDSSSSLNSSASSAEEQSVDKTSAGNSKIRKFIKIVKTIFVVLILFVVAAVGFLGLLGFLEKEQVIETEPAKVEDIIDFNQKTNTSTIPQKLSEPSAAIKPLELVNSKPIVLSPSNTVSTTAHNLSTISQSTPHDLLESEKYPNELVELETESLDTKQESHSLHEKFEEFAGQIEKDRVDLLFKISKLESSVVKNKELSIENQKSLQGLVEKVVDLQKKIHSKTTSKKTESEKKRVNKSEVSRLPAPVSFTRWSSKNAAFVEYPKSQLKMLFIGDSLMGWSVVHIDLTKNEIVYKKDDQKVIKKVEG
ncbi:hypothetical protein [Thiomicrorhabdus indica]|uniref:hypothetical protein n=1 Tax=Thiomicrorhabdus indica TaxID=2267253 RepID=UPI00102E0960|nr:hypothetical protein [Thiomicrorhabdus indica]